MALYDAVWGDTATFPFTPGPAQTAMIVVASLFFYWAVGTALWTYFGSLWALYRLGKETLRLRPYHEDLTLGLRPLGGLSLSLSIVYFSALGLVAAQTVLIRYTARPSHLVLLAILAIVGIGMVYLPLYHIHRQMAEVKAREQESARARFVRILDSRGAPSSGSGEPLQAVRGLLADMKEILAQEAIERKVAAIPTWPFDTRVVVRLSAVASSIVVAVLIKVVIDYVLRI